MQRWYALLTKPRREYRVGDALEAQGLDVYVPSIEYHGKRGNLLDKPFFPCYIFAKFDWETLGWSSVQWTPGLSRVVTFDGKPAWLAEKRVKYLRSKLEGIDGDEFLKMKAGDKVRVKEGPFREVEAVFAGHLNGQMRVAVLLDILGRQTRLILDRNQIESA
jgi:transcriptional antiterminator RfaH